MPRRPMGRCQRIAACLGNRGTRLAVLRPTLVFEPRLARPPTGLGLEEQMDQCTAVRVLARQQRSALGFVPRLTKACQPMPTPPDNRSRKERPEVWEGSHRTKDILQEEAVRHSVE